VLLIKKNPDLIIDLFFSAGFVGMIWRRLSSQLLQLRTIVLSIIGLGGHPSANQQAGLVRDGFGLHKMIVVASSAGKVGILFTDFQ
jgi:hypothetical protein